MRIVAGMIDRVINHYKLILAGTAVVFALFALQLPHVKIDNGVDNFLPDDNPVTVANKKYEAVFGPGTAILIAFEAEDVFDLTFLRRIGELTAALEKVNGKIREDNRRRNLDRFVTLFGDRRIGSAAGTYLQSMPVRTLDDLNRYMDEMEMQMNGISDSDAKQILVRYRRLNADQRAEIVSMVSGAYIREVTSLINADYVEGRDNTFFVENMVDFKKLDAAEVARLKERLRKWDVYDRLLISSDKRSVSIIVRLEEANTRMFETVLRYVKKEIRNSPLSRHKYYIAGEPVVTAYLGTYMIRDLTWLFPLVVILVMGTLLASFRRFGSMIVPMIAVLFSTVIVLGLMAVFKVEITVITTVLPVLMIAVGSAYGIHVINHYQLSTAADDREAVRESVTATFTPVAMAAFTTFGGFGALISNQVVPIKHFGIFTAIGVALAFFAAVVLVPALILLLRVHRPAHNPGETVERPNRFLHLLSTLSVKRHRLVLAAGALLLAASIVGLLRMQVDTDMVRMFKYDSDIRVSDRYLNRYYKGTATAEIVIDAGRKNGAVTPAILKAVDGLEHYLQNNPRVPLEIRTNIGGVMSVCDYLKKANKALHNGDQAWYRIEDDPKVILDHLLLLSSSIDDICNRDKSAVKALVSVKSGSTRLGRQLEQVILEYFRSRGINNARFLGYLSKTVTVDRLIVKGQIYSMLLSLLVVFILNAAVFRSFIGSLISLVPLSIAILINFGLMGFGGILLDIATSMISSIAIGIGIDYTIHFISGFKERFSAGIPVEESLTQTGLTTGRAILYNMIAVMAGFAVLLFSSFVPLVNFGLLIAITMVTTGIASLTIVPAIITGFSRLAFIRNAVSREREQFDRLQRRKRS